MVAFEGHALLLHPDSGEAHVDIDAIPADLVQHEALCRQCVEGLLVFRGSQVVACLPGGDGALLEDGGKAGLAIDRVAADGGRPESLLDQIVEGGLVLVGRQVVACLEGWAATLLPDCGEPGIPPLAIASDRGEAEALGQEAVESRLVGGGVDPMAGLPSGAAPFSNSAANRVVKRERPTACPASFVPDWL